MKFPVERFNVFFANLTNSYYPESVDLPTEQLPFESPESHLFEPQDQSPISAPPTVVPTQDQADDIPFEEAVPLEDELANLLDDID